MLLWDKDVMNWFIWLEFFKVRGGSDARVLLGNVEQPTLPSEFYGGR